VTVRSGTDSEARTFDSNSKSSGAAPKQREEEEKKNKEKKKEPDRTAALQEKKKGPVFLQAPEKRTRSGSVSSVASGTSVLSQVSMEDNCFLERLWGEVLEMRPKEEELLGKVEAELAIMAKGCAKP